MSGRNWMAMTGGIHSTLFTMYDLRRGQQMVMHLHLLHEAGFVEVGQGRVGVPVAPEDAHVPLAHVQHQRQHRPGVEHGAVREQEEEEDDEPVVRAEEHLVLQCPHHSVKSIGAEGFNLSEVPVCTPRAMALVPWRSGCGWVRRCR